MSCCLIVKVSLQRRELDQRKELERRLNLRQTMLGDQYVDPMANMRREIGGERNIMRLPEELEKLRNPEDLPLVDPEGKMRRNMHKSWPLKPGEPFFPRVQWVEVDRGERRQTIAEYEVDQARRRADHRDVIQAPVARDEIREERRDVIREKRREVESIEEDESEEEETGRRDVRRQATEAERREAASRYEDSDEDEPMPRDFRRQPTSGERRDAFRQVEEYFDEDEPMGRDVRRKPTSAELRLAASGDEDSDEGSDDDETMRPEVRREATSPSAVPWIARTKIPTRKTQTRKTLMRRNPRRRNQTRRNPRSIPLPGICVARIVPLDIREFGS